ncbi:MAG: hypothetical protein CMH13_07885 [Martelella sp.]|uniref:FAD/NAD(P)-binding protein n=1 Tax=unclassified Martelella TaxID=2629616 RepID=UPI000C6BA94A|nr:FAD/NAD(P)-binding protein [Martelella sp.]MAU20442.1 hypothetical protein [Martelella sp.]
MSSKIAIIGSGPTGIYTLKGLIGEHAPLEITIFEREDMPGKGMPYQPHINDRAMLSNIASIEIPPICESLTAWLRRQSDAALQEFGIAREAIAERTFYTRVVLGEYLQAQFFGLVQQGRENGHRIAVRAAHRVSDIALMRDGIELTVETPAGDYEKAVFDHVVLATGHDWPEVTETRAGYFVSPWPAPALKSIPPSKVGILGTSLSGIDALITVATAHGGFLLDDHGDLQYQPHADTEGFRATMMSRKGILPEADFYCEIPYRPLVFCTEEAIERLIATHEHGLLDAIFALFRQELALADPDYAARIGLSMLSVETLAPAYFRERQSADPFAFAARNLAEAEMNQKRQYTVEWRYAILRMHEVIACAIPHLDAADLERFHKHFKTVFVDDYATVPHDSIRRLLALHRAGKLAVKAIGDDAEIDNECVQRGAVVRFDGQELRFDAFIDATGQSSLSARDLPFSTLVGQGVVSPASTRGSLMADGMVRTGGVDLDAAFRPIFNENLSRNLYCGSISFLLHKLPFVQGITSARDIGDVISAAILESEAEGALTAA